MIKYAEVIPSIRIKRDLGVFDYQIPLSLEGKLKIGHLVEIPFRKRNQSGIVIKIKKKTEFQDKEIKSIIKILQPQPVLLENQIQLGFWLSEYYYVSPALVIKSMLPDFPKRSLKRQPLGLPIGKSAKLTILKKRLPEITKLTKEIRKNKKVFLLHYDNETEKLVFFLNSIRDFVKKDKQVLIIVPEIEDIAKIYPILVKKFFPKVVYLHSQLTKTNYYLNWNKILEGKAKVIIGTKLVLFTPLKNLGLVIIDQEENPNHKQSDQNPRYHARKVGLKLAEIYQAKSILTSMAPSLESFYQSNMGNYHLLRLISKPTQINSQIIDMREELKKQNYSIFSEKLQETIESNLKKKEKILLFLNRRGLATSIICQDCGYLFICPQCLMPLAFHISKELICHHCALKKPSPLFCPHCQGTQIKFFGKGTQKIEIETKKLFPQAKISRIDIDTFNKKSDWLKADITIGTSFILKRIHFSLFNLLGVISADTILYLPDFKANERTFQLITSLILNQKEAEILIQTFLPQNLAITQASRLNYQKFYLEELKNRQKFNYPPFSQLIKLMNYGPDNQKVSEETQEIFKKLKIEIKGLKKIELLGPLPAFVSQKRGKYFWYIIIKHSHQDQKIKNIFKIIPDNWIIDIDPESLL